MSEYQGHRSWNAWNVALWINNSEADYLHAYELVKKHGVIRAARQLTLEYKGDRTPDGARYNFTCIREAISDIID